MGSVTLTVLVQDDVMIFPVVVIAIALLPGSLAQVCYPGEDLHECSKRFSKTKTASSTETAFTTNTTCLGTKKDLLGFLGVCVDQRNDCDSGVTSSSLDCGSAMICCQDKHRNSIVPKQENGWTYDNMPVFLDNLENLNKPDCGFSRVSFVLGGQKAPQGAFPFIVSFTQNVSHPKQWKTFCGGVMISSQHVLTAAHCFDNLDDSLYNYNVRVRIGVSDLEQKIKNRVENRKTFAKIKKVTLHPKFKRRVPGYLNPFNDIAVVELHLLRGTHKTICLPTQIDQRKEDQKATGVVAGYGSTNAFSSTGPQHLVYAHVKPVEWGDCKAKYADFVGGIPGDVYIGSNVICAGDNTTDACSGDSGSPLLWVDDKTRWTVVGVVSFGPSVCGQEVPGAYTKVENYMDFIKHIISS